MHYNFPNFYIIFIVQYNTMSISRAPWCLCWVGTEALGEVALRPKSRRQLWTVRFSVL